MIREPVARDAFVEWMNREGAVRYHDKHPMHVAMHDGKLTKAELQAWVLNRYYYQTRAPIKDALILSKSADPSFRRRWIRRIHDHDGREEGEGGLRVRLDGAGFELRMQPRPKRLRLLSLARDRQDQGDGKGEEAHLRGSRHRPAGQRRPRRCQVDVDGEAEVASASRSAFTTGRPPSERPTPTARRLRRLAPGLLRSRST